jgi:hypothetical protein
MNDENLNIEIPKFGQPVEVYDFHQKLLQAQEEQSDVRNLVRNIIF